MKNTMNLLAAAAVIATSFAGAAMAEVKKVTIATEGAFAPYNLTRADGTLDGYDVELGMHLCGQMKIECTFVAQPFDSSIPALNAGKFDAIMSGMSRTAKRAEVIDFSEAYGRLPQAFATLSTNSLANLEYTGETFSLATNMEGAQKVVDDVRADFKGKVAGVAVSTIAGALVKNFLSDDVSIREYKTADEHDLDLKAGRVDFIVSSLAYLNALKEKPGYENVKIVGPQFQGGLLGPGIGIGFRKGETELKDMFDKAIAEAIADGTIKSLSEKWFNIDITPR
jgi:octopine/nopaline transport system substrate-binding protein